MQIRRATPSRLVRRSGAAVAAGLLAATVLAPVPSAGAADRTSAGPMVQRSFDHGPTWDGAGLEWEPFRSSGFEVPAGHLCDFPLKSEPIEDEEMVATLARFPDGSPQVQAFKGKLVVRYTNLASGSSVDVDLSGKALMHYFEDGSYTMYLYGPVGVGMNDEDAYPRGMYVMDGFHVVHTEGDEDRDRRVVADAGTERNICDSLA